MPDTPRRRTATVIAATFALSLFVPNAATAATQDDYAALGDSYASGSGTRKPDRDIGCYRSSHAYGPLIEQERPDTALAFPACQGAVTGDVINNQVSALSADTDYVSVSIGGNDIGFLDLVLNCGQYWDEQRCLATIDEAHRKIDEELPAKLDKTYAAITSAAPNATVMAVGYPYMFGDDVSCLDANGYTETEAAAFNGIVDHLEATISERSAAAGITFISTIEQFTGHDMCASDPYINGKAELNAGDMYHPSPAGYRDGFKPLVRQVMG